MLQLPVVVRRHSIQMLDYHRHHNNLIPSAGDQHPGSAERRFDALDRASSNQFQKRSD